MGPLDREVIERRLARLESVLRLLERDAGVSRAAYLADEDLQARVERRLQLAAQVCLDVANYLLARAGFELPDDEANAFLALARAGALDVEVGERLKGLVRFRNILVHDYLDVDAAIVHRHLTHDLADLRAFAVSVVGFLGRTP